MAPRRQLMKKQPTTVDEWIEAKKKFPKTYTVSPEGTLLAPPSVAGETERQISLTPRILASIETIQAAFAKRKEEVQAAEVAATAARRALHSVVDAYKRGEASAGDVVIANEEAKVAEAAVIQIAVAPREASEVVPDPEIRQLLLDNPYLVNKVADDVFQVRRATFPWTLFYEAVAKQEEPQPVETAAPAAPSAAAAVEPDATAKAMQGAIIAARKKKRVLIPPPT